MKSTLFLWILLPLILTVDTLSIRISRQSGSPSDNLAFQNSAYTYCLPNPVNRGSFVDQLFLSSPTPSTQFFIPSQDPRAAINPANGQLFVAQPLPSGQSFTVVIQATDYSSNRTATTFVTIGATPCDSNSVTITTTTTPTPTPTLTPFSTTNYRFTITNCSSGSYIGPLITTNPSGPPILRRFSWTYQIETPNRYVQVYPNGKVYLTAAPPQTDLTFRVNAMNGFKIVGSSTVTITVNCPLTTTSNPITSISNRDASSQCVATPYTAPLAFGQSEFAFSIKNCAAGQPVGQTWLLSPPTTPVTFTLAPGSSFIIDPTTGTLTNAVSLPAGVIQPVTLMVRDSQGRTATGCARIQTASLCENAA